MPLVAGIGSVPPPDSGAKDYQALPSLPGTSSKSLTRLMVTGI